MTAADGPQAEQRAAMIETAAQARAVEPGTVVLSQRQPPVTRVQIAWYLVASCDLNPIHVDEPFARQAGFQTVVGQGMLPLGFLARELVRIVGLQRIRRLGGDFVGPVLPDDALTIELRVLQRHEAADGLELRWQLTASGDDGKPRVRGHASTWHEESPAELS
ncbi:MAG: MaoC family dehydratase [Burkholderiaceae bacterium]